MFLKHIDFLSPQITLYYKGYLSHSTIISGIISIISFILIILLAIYYSLDLIKRENPIVYFFNRFVDNTEVFPLNSSSLFHYITLGNNNVNKKFDFTSFRIIGLEEYYTYYLENRNLKEFDHWLYGFCKNEIDTKGIEHLINKEIFEYSACIKKFFDSKRQSYFEIGDSNFKWPTIKFINSNSEGNGYSIIIEKCEEDSLNLILGKENICKSDLEIQNYFSGTWGIRIHFIDHYVDILNYKEPNMKYFFSIDNTLDKDNYSINHLNFNPSSIITNNGIIFDNIKEELSYIYERNDAFVEKSSGNKVYMIYNIWMKNRMQCYKRIYKTIQNVISNIGGFSQFITIFATIINSIYNNYIILYDSHKLLSPYINKRRNKTLYNNNLSNINKYSNNSDENKSNNEETNKNINSKCNLEKKKTILKSNSNFNNYAYINENGYKDDTQIVSDKNNEIINIEKNKEMNFWNYLIFRINCRKNNNYFKIYEKFRIKIISEEHLIKNHLNVYGLLKMSEINGFELENKHQLEELIDSG